MCHLPWGLPICHLAVPSVTFKRHAADRGPEDESKGEENHLVARFNSGNIWKCANILVNSRSKVEFLQPMEFLSLISFCPFPPLLPAPLPGYESNYVAWKRGGQRRQPGRQPGQNALRATHHSEDTDLNDSNN